MNLLLAPLLCTAHTSIKPIRTSVNSPSLLNRNNKASVCIQVFLELIGHFRVALDVSGNLVLADNVVGENYCWMFWAQI